MEAIMVVGEVAEFSILQVKKDKKSPWRFLSFMSVGPKKWLSKIFSCFHTWANNQIWSKIQKVQKSTFGPSVEFRVVQESLRCDFSFRSISPKCCSVTLLLHQAKAFFRSSINLALVSSYWHARLLWLCFWALAKKRRNEGWHQTVWQSEHITIFPPENGASFCKQ